MNPPNPSPGPARPLGLGPGTWALLAALAAVALYLPSIGYQLVYDSHPQILVDDFIHQPRHFADVLSLRVLGMDVLDFNRPLNLFTLLVDSLLWGKNPAGYHLTNILLHGATVAALFGWLLRLVGRFWPALLAALFFAFHPLNCETVAEVSYREDLLATLFMLGGLACATFFEPGARGKTWLPALGTAGCLFLSVASKESGVAGVAALAAFWFLFRRGRGAKTRNAWLLLLLGTGLACGGFLAARFGLEPKGSIIFTAPPSRLAASWGELLPLQTRIWAGEFLRIVWPADLCADYTGYSIRNIGLGSAILGVGLLAGVQLLAGWHNRLIALGAAVFWFSLFPVSNFIPIYRPMADRFLYMPLTGVALMLAVSLASLPLRRNTSRNTVRWAAGGAAAAALAALATAAFCREQVWRDPLSLWQDNTARNPFSADGWTGLAFAKLDLNRPGEALEPLLRAARLTQGKSAPVLGGLALAEDAAGRPREAARALEAAVALDPRYAQPEKLVDALTLDPSQARRIAVIALRSKKL